MGDRKRRRGGYGAVRATGRDRRERCLEMVVSGLRLTH
jgi:hypothetical protein